MLTIIECPDNNKRRKIHQYLDNKIPKVSLFCKKFKTSNLYVKTFYLSHTNGKTYNYNYDDFFTRLDNNYFSDKNEALKDAMLISGHNIIAHGDYLKNYVKPKHAILSNVSEDEYNEIIKELNIYTIPEPNKPLNKRDLSYYIVIELEKKYGKEIKQPIYYPGLGYPKVIEKGEFSKNENVKVYW